MVFDKYLIKEPLENMKSCPKCRYDNLKQPLHQRLSHKIKSLYSNSGNTIYHCKNSTFLRFLIILEAYLTKEKSENNKICF